MYMWCVCVRERKIFFLISFDLQQISYFPLFQNNCCRFFTCQYIYSVLLNWMQFICHLPFSQSHSLPPVNYAWLYVGSLLPHENRIEVYAELPYHGMWPLSLSCVLTEEAGIHLFIFLMLIWCFTNIIFLTSI